MGRSYSCQLVFNHSKLKDDELFEMIEKFKKYNKPILIVFPDEKEMFGFVENWEERLESLCLLPPHDNLPFDLKPSSHEMKHLRIKSIFNLLKKRKGIFFSCLRSVLSRTISLEKFLKYSFVLRKNERFLEDYFNIFSILGYRKVDTVRKMGEYSRRGYIVDVFSTYSEHPVRLELFDDEIIDMRLFDISNQRSFKKIEEIWITPVHDYVFDAESIDSFNEEISGLYEKFGYHEFIDRIQTNMDSLDSLAGIFNKNGTAVLDLFEARDGILILIDPKRCEKNYMIYLEELFKIYPGRIFKYMYSRYSAIDMGRILSTNMKKILVEREHPSRRFHATYKSTWITSKEVWLEDELKIGDYVVHKDYGIGRFNGIVEIENYTGKRDYIEIIYKDDVKLFVPVEKIHRIHKYIGPTDGLKLSDIRGGEWVKLKERVRKDLERKVNDLLKLYALRMKSRKEPMKGDPEIERQFELSFPYIETNAQMEVLEEIYKDMESEIPMDRLLCGDSGVGKTEVAMRAAVRAISSGKQVAFLVPTVVLARQHYENYVKRFREIGMRIELFDSTRTRKERKRLIEELKNGKIDMIIGTHGLLLNDVKFRDLGLLIIDEEQRFGVFQKEKLKRLKLSVDVLSISATPIPRTLYMALSGIKGLSVMDGGDNRGVKVELIVTPFDERIVKKAILLEISRGGQVIYIHNRINELEKIAENLRNEFRNLKIEIAHGRMPKKILTEILDALYSGELDVLVTTTILESGIDLPNANTMIVDDSHRYGIAELYQIRGRVGRGQRKGYAYFMYPVNELTEDSKKRLKFLSSKENLKGMNMAILDMEIRGIGNVLGIEQHGNAKAIGYKLYVEILEDIFKRHIKEFERTNRIDDELFERSVMLNIKGMKVDAKIPSEYIPDVVERLNIYKKISGIKRIQDLKDVKDEIIDRFGKPPMEVENLLKLSELKLILSRHRIKQIKVVDNMDEELKVSNDTLFVNNRKDLLEFLLNTLKEW